MHAEHLLALMSNSQVLARFGAKLRAPAVLNTASGLPIDVEGHFCKVLTVQAVPTAQCLRLGPTESACQSFSAFRYTIDSHNYAKRYDFVCVTTQTRSITVRLSLGTSMAIMRGQSGALQDRALLDSVWNEQEHTKSTSWSMRSAGSST